MQLEIKDVPLMINVLETYMEGIKEAQSYSEADVGTLDTPEKLLASMAQYDEDYATLSETLERLKNEVGT